MAGFHVVGHLHNVVEASGLRAVAADVEHGDQAGMSPGDGLEFLDPLKLAFERLVAVEPGAVHDFHGAKNPQQIVSRQPDHAIAACADAAQ